MGHKQIVVIPNKKFVDKKAQSYILVEDFIRQKCIDKYICGKYEMIEEVFKNEHEYIEANEYIVRLTRRMIEQYTPVLNEYHKISFSPRQWTIIMSVWLRFALFDLYSRYKKLELVKGNDVYLLGARNYVVELRAVDETRAKIRSHEKNAYMWTLVADRMGIIVKTKDIHFLQKAKPFMRYLKKAKDDPAKVVKYLKERLFVSSAKTETNKNPYDLKKSRVLLFGTSLPDSVEREFVKQSDGKIGAIPRYGVEAECKTIINKHNRDLTLRNSLFSGKFCAENEFEKIAVDIISRIMPVAYVEAFGELLKRAEEISKDWKITKMYTAYTGIELFDFWAALLQPQKTKICCIQHSAVYGGIYTHHIGECVYGDEFLTWGWNVNQFNFLSTPLKPVAMIRLPKTPDPNGYKVKNKYLLACNYGIINDGGIGYLYGDYINKQMEFIESLDEEIRRQLVIRFDPTDNFNIELIHRCHKKYSYIRFENRYDIPFTDSLLESKLVVCDYYGSTHLEALMLGKPFVMFDGVKIVSYNPCLKKYLPDFERAGLYVKDGVEMAKVLNRHKDIDKWINSEENKILLTNYLNEFAGADTNVYEKWYKAFYDNE